MFEKREVQKRPLLMIIDSVFIAQSIHLTLLMHFQAWFWCRAWWDASFEAYFICLSGGLVFFDNPVFSHMMSRSRACACCLAYSSIVISGSLSVFQRVRNLAFLLFLGLGPDTGSFITPIISYKLYQSVSISRLQEKDFRAYLSMGGILENWHSSMISYSTLRQLAPYTNFWTMIHVVTNALS